MKICVYGVGHLGIVTAACLAEWGHDVVGLDTQAWQGHESGLEKLVNKGVDSGRLTFTEDHQKAMADADVLWVTYDMPTNLQHRINTDWLYLKLNEIYEYIKPNMLVIISSQVYVGFTDEIGSLLVAKRPDAQIAYIPENLRKGQAIQNFLHPDRIIVGGYEDLDSNRIIDLLRPIRSPILWMDTKSAEMTKHALNSFLAMSIAFANEIAELSEAVGANYLKVEDGLKSDNRVGHLAYLGDGEAQASSLLREVETLKTVAQEQKVSMPLIEQLSKPNKYFI